LAGLTVTAIGIAMLVWMFKNSNGVDRADSLALIVFGFGGFTLLGTGILTPFGRPRLGAVIGFMVPLGYVIFVFCYLLVYPVIGYHNTCTDFLDSLFPVS